MYIVIVVVEVVVVVVVYDTEGDLSCSGLNHQGLRSAKQVGRKILDYLWAVLTDW